MKGEVNYKTVVRLTLAGGYTQREIAAAARCGSSTVSDIQKRIRASGLDEKSAEEMSEAELRGLLTERRGRKVDESYEPIDHAFIQDQLDHHRGLSLVILWEEYARSASEHDKPAYMYSRFVELHRRWQEYVMPTVKAPHVPADRMEVDWAGDTMEWVDLYTGETHTVYLFVATLPYSQYTFVKPAEAMDQDAWIACNIAALRYFGGCPRIIVIDNLKTGVVSNRADEVVLNRAFAEFGEHYGCAIIPAGVNKPPP